MKNTLVKLLLLAALVSCLFIFASCDKLDISLEDASEIFEDEEWIVNFEELDEGLIVARLSANNGEEDDDKAYFTMIEYKDEDLAKAAYDAEKLEREQDKEEAKMRLEKYELQLETYNLILENYGKDIEKDEYKEMIKELEEKIEELQEEIDTYDDDYKMGRDGAVVWYGSLEAYELLTK